MTYAYGDYIHDCVVITYQSFGLDRKKQVFDLLFSGLPDRILNLRLRLRFRNAIFQLIFAQTRQIASDLRGSSSVKTKQKDNEARCTSLSFWPARQDSNLRSQESESCALSSCATGSYFTCIVYHIHIRFSSPSFKFNSIFLKLPLALTCGV